jgi:hypothetical protein
LTSPTGVTDQDLSALRTIADANRVVARTLPMDSRVGRMLSNTADELDALRGRCEDSGAASSSKHLADKIA